MSSYTNNQNDTEADYQTCICTLVGWTVRWRPCNGMRGLGVPCEQHREGVKTAPHKRHTDAGKDTTDTALMIQTIHIGQYHAKHIVAKQQKASPAAIM